MPTEQALKANNRANTKNNLFIVAPFVFILIRQRFRVVFFFCLTASPLSSFSFECVPQHFFGSIGTFHTPLCHPLLALCHMSRPSKNTLHTYQNVHLKNSDNYSHNFYTLSSLLKKFQSFLNFVLIHLIIFYPLKKLKVTTLQ